MVDNCENCENMAYVCGDYFCNHSDASIESEFLHYPFKIPEWCPKKDMEVHERGEK